MFENEKLYTVGCLRYSDNTERKRKVWGTSENDAIRKIQAALWQFNYDEFYIVEEEN